MLFCDVFGSWELPPNGPYFACKIVAFGREPSGFSEFRLNKTGELALHRYKVRPLSFRHRG